jgi:hypothetical protein
VSTMPPTEEDWVYVPRMETVVVNNPIETVVVNNPTTPNKPITSTRPLGQKMIHRHAKSSQPANLILDLLEDGAPELAHLLRQRKA